MFVSPNHLVGVTVLTTMNSAAMLLTARASISSNDRLFRAVNLGKE